jgi:uncharacterized membrane protein
MRELIEKYEGLGREIVEDGVVENVAIAFEMLKKGKSEGQVISELEKLGATKEQAKVYLSRAQLRYKASVKKIKKVLSTAVKMLKAGKNENQVIAKMEKLGATKDQAKKYLSKARLQL